MKKIITIIVLAISINSYSQRLAINKKANKKEAILKVTLPKNYELKFFKNRKLVKKIKFTGVKKFKVEKINDYRLTWKSDKKTKTFNIYFDNDLEDFIEDRIIDIQKIF